MTERIVSFPAVATPAARVLILGSMPGEASLQAGQYYAHPRNAFWPIMREFLGFGVTASYRERLRVLEARGIALWDVLKSCHRTGSLDSRIEPDSMVANDFESFFGAHRRISLVCFNGATAERCYRQQILPKLQHLSLPCVRLPSTSPAHASLSVAGKAAAWRSAMQSHVPLHARDKGSPGT